MADRSKLTYTGSAALAGQFAQMLQDEGLRVDWEPPLVEGRDATFTEAVVELSVSGLAVSGMQTACRTAYRRFRERFPRRGTVTSDDIDLDVAGPPYDKP
jgi:hypothetical protein